MSYTPATEQMNSLGFTSLENENAFYRVWTNQTGKQQIRAHRNSGSTWLDYYERTDSASPWRKQAADPAPATEQEFRCQLTSLGWLSASISTHYTLTLVIPSMATSLVTTKMLYPYLFKPGYATWSSSSQ